MQEIQVPKKKKHEIGQEVSIADARTQKAVHIGKIVRFVVAASGITYAVVQIIH